MIFFYDTQPWQVPLQEVNKHEHHGLQIIPSRWFLPLQHIHTIKEIIDLRHQCLPLENVLSGFIVYVLLTIEQVVEMEPVVFAAFAQLERVRTDVSVDQLLEVVDLQHLEQL